MEDVWRSYTKFICKNHNVIKEKEKIEKKSRKPFYENISFVEWLTDKQTKLIIGEENLH